MSKDDALLLALANARGLIELSANESLFVDAVLGFAIDELMLSRPFTFSVGPCDRDQSSAASGDHDYS